LSPRSALWTHGSTIESWRTLAPATVIVARLPTGIVGCDPGDSTCSFDGFHVLVGCIVMVTMVCVALGGLISLIFFVVFLSFFYIFYISCMAGQSEIRPINPERMLGAGYRRYSPDTLPLRVCRSVGLVANAWLMPCGHTIVENSLKFHHWYKFLKKINKFNGQ
jgi:hypothetical protein